MANSILIYLDSHEVEAIPKPRGKWAAEVIRRELARGSAGTEYAFMLSDGTVKTAVGKTPMAAAMALGYTKEQTTDGRFVKHGTVEEAREQGWFWPAAQVAEEPAMPDEVIMDGAKETAVTLDAPQRPKRRRAPSMTFDVSEGAPGEQRGDSAGAAKDDEDNLFP